MSNYVAAAAAAASSPGVTNSVHLDSLDARIVQYQYGLLKLSRYVEKIRELRDICREKGPETVFPIPTYPMLLSGSIFNLSDNIFRRSEILINGGKFNPAQSVDPPTNTNSVNYDIMENATNYDTTKLIIPESKRSFESLRLFEHLIINAHQIYSKKLQQALQERTACRVPDSAGYPQTFDWAEISDLLQPVELAVIPSFIYETTPENSNDAEAVRQSMRDSDLKVLKAVTESVDVSLATLRDYLSIMCTCKTKEVLLKAPHASYMMHRGFAILLRLADLYAVLRRIGKRVYLFNYHHFQNYVRLDDGLRHALAVVTAYFNQPKKNNVLLASVTKLTRQGAYAMVRSDSTLAIAKQGIEACALITAMNESLKNLAIRWTDLNKKNFNLPNKAQMRDRLRVQTAELKRQSSLISPDGGTARRLEAMYIDPEKNKQEMERQSKLQKEREDAAKEDRQMKEAEERENVIQRKEMIALKAEERERYLREELSRTSSPLNGTPSNNLSRRSSIRSSSSGSSRSSSLVTAPSQPETIKRSNGSLTRSASQRFSPTTKTSGLARRHSVSLHPVPAEPEELSTSSSVRSLSPSHSSSASSASSTGNIFTSPTALRRQNPANINGEGAKSAVAGAMTAFPKTNIIRETKQPSLQARMAAASVPAAQKATNGKPLSAQQRLQRHIMNSTLRGEMTTKPIVDVPRVLYTPSARAGIVNGSRTSSLQGSLGRTAGSSGSSRTSSLASGRDSVSPINSLKSASAAELRHAQPQQNRSRSGSIQSVQSIQEESMVQSAFPSPTSSAPAVVVSSPLVERTRSNSASKRPAGNITKIEENTPNIFLVKKEGQHVPNTSSPGSSILIRSRAGSIASSLRTDTTAENEHTLTESNHTTPVKKVRFLGVPEYSEAEDAPSPQKKKMWAKAPPVFRFNTQKTVVDNTRKKERLFTAQEGLAFRKNTHTDEWGGFNRNKAKQPAVEANGKVSMMSLVTETATPTPTIPVPKGKLTQLFKRR
ncbi:unnamed protein product [Kuraishia capsulata CBS 1993]|uniref:Uncharacterized protein n=1 Tax=Kuraishia capsulata CBS 1993 TaxID=1382522 RepID=W6MSS2_9ASCO|nr:uncharacterized protein KUCA_T00005406001 [Kuraishia capsulata CBS 1993]CDK29418.1 unnamed protein product [Kuraishia capsulata CBS 1993]